MNTQHIPLARHAATDMSANIADRNADCIQFKLSHKRSGAGFNCGGDSIIYTPLPLPITETLII